MCARVDFIEYCFDRHTMIEWRFLSTQHLNEFASNSVETYKPISYVIGQFYMYDCVISVCSLNHVHDTRT